MQYKHLEKLDEIPELSRLTRIPSPPRSLFIRGQFQSQLFADCVAVVGSRRMTDYGRQVIDKLIPKLVLQGKTIVSGFMYGVDQYAHRICVAAGGKTIAVLGWGIDISLDPVDQQLAQDILNSGGLIISEWKNQLGTLWTFPVRNRIVAGLSQEIYVIEAAEKSGSLLTAELGLKFHKKIWAIPGPITSKTSYGTNTLIKTGKAEMWLGDRPIAAPSSTDPILRLLVSEPLSTNDIARRLKQPVAQVGARLSTLELTNQISLTQGKYHPNLC